MSSPPTVIVYRNRLLPVSETFIRAQADHLTRYASHYLGCSFIAGSGLPDHRTMLINTGGVAGRTRELLYKATGRDPRTESRLRALEARLVHAHFGVDAALVAPMARHLGLPLIVTFHGYDVTVRDSVALRSSATQRISLRRRALLFRYARRGIAVSEFIRSRLVALGFPADRIVRHYIGIDTERFRPAMGALREPTVLFVGRLVEKKGCEYLIRAMVRVRAAFADARLSVIGDGPLRGYLERLAAPLGASCRFLGARSSNEVREAMCRASVFCVPSVTATSGDAEAFGLVFTEAQAVGTPVVSTRSGGIPEAVLHGQTGLLVPEKDPNALASAIGALLGDHDLWLRLSAAGIQHVRRRFDLRTQMTLLERIYDDCLAEHEERPRATVATRCE